MKALSARRRITGFTLIELMVALVVGMVVVLSVVAVQKAFENQRRTTTSGNDVDNAGAYALSQIDDLVRPAGSGFTQAYSQTFGCALSATSGGGAVLPQATFPAPFTNVMGAIGTLRMAPVLIIPGNTAVANLNQGNGSSDVLMVMSGAGTEANIQTLFTGPAAATTLTVQSAAGFNPGDLLLVMDTPGTTGPAPCWIEQVAAGAIASGATTLNLGGTYYSSAAVQAPPAGVSVNGAAVPIGNYTNVNYPSFELIGVNQGNQLYAYDLLQLQGTTALPIGDSVMELHARYGTATAGGVCCTWVDPGAAGSPYSAANLMSGTFAASALLNQIKAVRVGLILKSPLLENMVKASATTYTHVTTGPLTLFSDLGAALTYTRTLDSPNADGCTVAPSAANTPVVGCEKDYRYRTLELTIPLRNTIIY
jgi:type IV pilus assembly protein PilW